MRKRAIEHALREHIDCWECLEGFLVFLAVSICKAGGPSHSKLAILQDSFLIIANNQTITRQI